MKIKKIKTERPKLKKPTGKTVGIFLLDYSLCALGGLLYALGVVCFINPVKFVPGGLTTLAILINHLVPVLPTGAMVFLLNVPLFIISWRVFGFGFISKTLFSTAMLSLFIDLMTGVANRFPVLMYSGDEKLVAAIFGGLFMGIGIGLVFLRGATTGGMDIVVRLLKLRFPHISVGKLVLACDFTVVMLAGAVYRSVNSILYSVIVIFLSSLAVDYVVAGRSHSKMLMILTDKAAEMTREITSTVDRGVTVFDVEGGYTGRQHKMLLCVVRTHEVAEIRKIAQKYDENPFIIITDSGEVLGEGFKSHKDTL